MVIILPSMDLSDMYTIQWELYFLCMKNVCRQGLHWITMRKLLIVRKVVIQLLFIDNYLARRIQQRIPKHYESRISSNSLVDIWIRSFAIGF